MGKGVLRLDASGCSRDFANDAIYGENAEKKVFANKENSKIGTLLCPSGARIRLLEPVYELIEGGGPCGGGAIV